MICFGISRCLSDGSCEVCLRFVVFRDAFSVVVATALMGKMPGEDECQLQR